MAKPAQVPDDKFKRERAGTYRSADGRFTVEQTSSGWLLMDGEQTDELGLTLARGPFATLEDARAAMLAARSDPAPTSDLRRPAKAPAAARAPARAVDARTQAADREPTPDPKRAPQLPHLRRAPARPRKEVFIREIRAVDGDALRALWRAEGFDGLGDDDRSLARLARRNPGLVLVAADGSKVVGSALGAWDGRRGWIYHVVTAPSHRRQGIATRLVDQIESALASLGCPKANVVIRSDSDGGAEFWAARGYEASPNRHYGKGLDPG